MAQIVVDRMSDRLFEVREDGIVIAHLLLENEAAIATLIPSGELDAEDVCVILQTNDYSRLERQYIKRPTA